MQILKRYRWALIAVAAATLITAFLAFRPDTIFIDNAVDESLGDAFAPTRSTTPEVPATTPVAPSADAPEPSPTTSDDPRTSPPQPMTVTTGGFVGIDHSAIGTATIYEQDGEFVLRFEDDTDIQNGPDLFVWLLASDDYTGGVPPEYLDLGMIKGNVGGQNYQLPAEYDPDTHRVVLVWCKRFSVPFAAAPLT